MAEHEYRVETALPIEVLWDFVKDMDHWAPFLTGYQTHEKHSETESTWTLKGDVGVLARIVVFDVVVTDWSGPERVAFTLTGRNEPLQGEGSFELGPAGKPAAPAAVAVATPPRGLAALWDRLVRWLFRRAAPEAPARAAPAAGEGRTRMAFRLRIEPGGPMAPMIDAMIQPAMAAAAEDLAVRILAALESQETR